MLVQYRTQDSFDDDIYPLATKNSFRLDSANSLLVLNENTYENVYYISLYQIMSFYVLEKEESESEEQTVESTENKKWF